MILVVLSVLVTLCRRRLSDRSTDSSHVRPSAAVSLPEVTAANPDTAGTVREALAR
jgi:hypothetical protein